MAPGGLFCMSGPVAHVDDGSDDDCGSIQTQQASLFQPLDFGRKKSDFTEKEEFDNHRLSDVEFLTDHFSECCVKFQCPDGTCKMLWSSGTSYKGEVLDSNLHGVGTYTGADGAVYDGNWILNKKHGFGRKKYVNGDVYEGSWKGDMPEGQGRYLWSNGSEYCGEWRNGLMCGVGVLTWAGGDSYDGQWLNGLADGQGVYTWADGSVYMGTWKEGLKVGQGRYFSPGRRSIGAASISWTCKSFQKTSVVGGMPIDHLTHGLADLKNTVSGGEECNACHDCLKQSRTLQEFMVASEIASPLDSTADMATCTHVKDQESLLFLERLRRLDSAMGSSRFSERSNLYERPEKRRSSAFCKEQMLDMISEMKSDIDLSSVVQDERPGEIINKRHRSYNLVTALQAGVRYSVLERSLASSGKKHEFGPKAAIKANLPKQSSQLTPAHVDIADFQWTDYCPTIFRQLRETSKIVATSYCQSICGAGALRELPSPGKSGCLFYLSQDDRFMIKTLRKAEVKTFLRMLKRYCKHIHTHENTLLTKFYGLHGVKLPGCQKVRFVVMGNVFTSDYQMDRIYDLKGSSEGRIAIKSEKNGFAPLKDLDLDVLFQLDPSSRKKILEQIDEDCKFLESERIMDYSLLLGLQYNDSSHDVPCSQARCSKVDMLLHGSVILDLPVKNGSSAESEEKEYVQHSESLRIVSSARPGLEEQTFTNESDHMEPMQGIHCRAKMLHKSCQGGHKGGSDAQNVVLYFGIIDILQEYDLSKRLEHAYKSLYYDPLTISAVDPAFYSKRFQQSLHQVFPEIT